MLYFFLSYCGIYPLQGVFPLNKTDSGLTVSPIFFRRVFPMFLPLMAEAMSFRACLIEAVFKISHFSYRFPAS